MGTADPCAYRILAVSNADGLSARTHQSRTSVIRPSQGGGGFGRFLTPTASADAKHDSLRSAVAWDAIIARVRLSIDQSCSRRVLV